MADFPAKFLQLTATIISQLIGLLQVKYQSENPFLTLSTTMLVTISSIIVCFIVQIGLLRFPTSSRFVGIAQNIFVSSAYAAISTLAAALSPAAVRPFIYTFFALLSTGHMFDAFRHQRANEGVGEGAGADEDEGERKGEDEDEDEGEV